MTEPHGTLDTCQVLLVGEAAWLETVEGALDSRTKAGLQQVPTAESAEPALESGRIDLVVAAADLPDRSGIELLETIRAETATLPVVLGAADGDEAIASDAIAAGVSDYLPIDPAADLPTSEILTRLERAVRRAQRAITQRERARQFDASFHDDRTLTWVLDRHGSLTRVNGRARELVSEPAAELVGRAFWDLPWWPESAQLRADLEQVVDTAVGGGFGRVVVTHTTGDTPGIVELSARPVENERGDVVSIVVEGVDISDRVAVERELRTSEELHRVTLNNMTDTVLITDEDGQFTYVCPNVHFIFGYTAEEIQELGSIEGLFGEPLFDAAELDDDGVLKNIECTATDKAGREHTLLVNVRAVSIQDGTRLYSCRDITKRKQRERALTTLQATAREFLFAETDHEIAQHVVDDVPEVLDTDASAVYLFDTDRNELQPAAVSPAFERLHGPPPAVSIDTETLESACFVEAERLVFDDVHRSDRLTNHASDIRSAAYIPLGDHGVFIAASEAVGAFDEVDRELADLLAASAEAALERVRRESRLRDQERELQRRNRQLSDVNRVNEIIREIDQALVQAETRAEIEHAVCERLTLDDRFTFAWIGTADPSCETVGPNTWAGSEQGYLDSLQIAVAATGTEPAGRTAATGEVSLVPTVAEQLREADWQKEAIARDYRSVMSVPLAYGEVSYGVLTVYATVQDAFDELIQGVLAELGETIASAMGAITRKNALLAPSMTRLELRATEPTGLLSRLAASSGCSIAYQGATQPTTAHPFVFVSFDGARPNAVERAAQGLVSVDGVDRISSHSEAGVLRLQLVRPFFALELADHGVVLRDAAADPDGTTLTLDVPDTVEVRHVTRLVGEAVGDVALVSKRSLDRQSVGTHPSGLLDQLTERQLEVLQTAYFSGFFESPRKNSGEDIAAVLGISPQAFYQHARTLQRKLFASLFDDPGVVAQPVAARTE